jgi:hypothetical protein
VGLILMPVWRACFLHGFAATQAAAHRALWLTLMIAALYLFLLWLKKTDRLFKTWTTS